MKCQKIDCIYRKPIYAYSNEFCCHYMLETGEKRNSDPEKCNKYKPEIKDILQNQKMK